VNNKEATTISALLQRLEKVVDSLQDNSVKMGQLLAVHNEKLDKQDRTDTILFRKLEDLDISFQKETDSIKKGCERDIKKIEERLTMMEKKMWTIFGAISVITFIVSPLGSKISEVILTNNAPPAIIDTTQ
jgi:hypothetical protein|tara:strand:+ start:1503 stop:1895 length:393 start_codon:yes stop_codon:yes gene_type:complete